MKRVLYTNLGFEIIGTTDMSIGEKISHSNHLVFEKFV